MNITIDDVGYDKDCFYIVMSGEGINDEQIIPSYGIQNLSIICELDESNRVNYDKNTNRILFEENTAIDPDDRYFLLSSVICAIPTHE